MAINALRRLVADEDKANLAIKQELERGPARIRALSREELKMEIKKYKNISLRCIKEMQRLGGKVPGFAASIVKEAETGEDMGGLKKMKTESNIALQDEPDELDDESMFENQEDEEGELPEKAREKIESLENARVKLNLELKEKNEKIIELMNDLEEIKIQVFARDKSVQLQQNQIDELLEELRESKSLENDVKILV